MTSTPDDIQERVLRCYTILHLLDPVNQPDAKTSWAGHLVLSIGLDPPGAALALAANIAGAISLAIDARPDNCRAALRTGACDFAVNSVDEALRVIKNEIRKRQPLSVALQVSPDQALDDLTGRGVKPTIVAHPHDPSGQHAPGIRYFQAHGTPIVNFDPAAATINDVIDGPTLLAQHLLAQHLHLYSFRFPTAPSLRAFDTCAADLLASDPIRQRWSLAAARYFLRERPHRRALLLQPDEQLLLTQAFAPHL